MSDLSFEVFADCYASLLILAWTDESFVGRLVADPAGTLDELGLRVPPGVTVNVEREGEPVAFDETSAPRDPPFEELHRKWLAGVKRNQLVLIIPDVPEVEFAELSDDQLDSVAAAGNLAPVFCVNIR